MAGFDEPRPHAPRVKNLLRYQDFFRRVDEIEVLRALAVGGVIANHAGNVRGGFLGVDVFFVISGYVITLLLLGGLSKGDFSLWDFYYRRIIRIIPPLLVVSAAVFLASWFLFFLPEDSEFIRESFFFQSFFAQNFFFVARSADYFQGLATAKLNLHTWSLAVEEQFYLVYPIVFLMLYQFRHSRWLPWVIGTVFIASLLLLTHVYEASIVPALARLLSSDLTGNALWGARYYLIFTRAWELLLGALTCMAAYRVHTHGTMGRFHMSAVLVKMCSMLSLGLVILSFLYVKETMSWPSVLTLLPTLATATLLFLIHLYGPAALPSIVNVRPIHTVGRASYSLYLWHWPVLGVLIYTNSDFGISIIDYVVYFAVVACLTFITYLLVEKQRHRLSNWHAWMILFTFSGLSLAASQLEHRPTDMPKEIKTVLETGAYAEECRSCDNIPSAPFIVLWGDSHSQMLVQTVEKASSKAGLQLVHVKGSLADDREGLIQLSNLPQFVGMIAASRWSMYAVGFPANEPEEKGTRYLALGGKTPGNGKEGRRNFQTHLQRFFSDFHGKPLLLVLEVPRYPFFPKKELIMEWAGYRLRPLPVKTLADHRMEQKETRSLILQASAQYPSARIADPANVLCDGGTCIWHEGWQLLYKDDDHLSVHGAERLQPLVMEFLQDAGASRHTQSVHQ